MAYRCHQGRASSEKQLDIVNHLPKDYVFLNYLRCHDDIGWGLDYATLQQEGIEERSHKKYLNDYFQGFAGESNSRGVLYNEDPVTGDARFCGTTASMCGIEKAGFEKIKRRWKSNPDGCYASCLYVHAVRNSCDLQWR